MISWQYIAGFFDGEGSISRVGNWYRIIISQTHYEVLAAIRLFAQVGHVAKLTKRQAHWKDAWIYYIAKQKDVALFLRGIAPYLIVKRQYVIPILSAVDKLVTQQNSRERIARNRKRQAKILRQRGYSYRKIGRVLGIDWGYARRIILGRRH